MVEKAPEKVIVPFSKGNVDKKPIPQNVFLTMGPMPMQIAVGAISETEAQGWTTRFIAYAGLVKSGNIMMAQQPSMPVYYVVICKVHNEGEELINPTVTMPEQGR